ncbi:hypothetical protein M422DRAFT_33699 [Sphaerobolus stellatus SS14]|uniref:Uncharacterized protein n=1 Tax=Sphaerobolus stellatus (strain SS14) TaxID=990650 RepID=A0A0C9VJ48_SPHS4|nr:hypothetical protein M422DRAFT_33699 [Sphaerobolus stellatus SS14]
MTSTYYPTSFPSPAGFKLPAMSPTSTTRTPSHSSLTFTTPHRYPSEDTRRPVVSDHEYDRYVRQGSPMQIEIEGVASSSYATSPLPPNGHSHPIPPTQSSTTSTNHSRHPSLSLNTSGLHGSRASTESAIQSPMTLSPLQMDLDTLKTNLEAVWKQAAKNISSLHTSTNEKDNKINSLTAQNKRLEEVLNRQQREIQEGMQQLRFGESRMNRAMQEIQQIKEQASREKSILNQANSRLWKDIAKLEGEKRELKVKLDAQAEYARLCRQQLAEASGKANVTVKLEEKDSPVEGQIPLSQVEEAIQVRLKRQEEGYSREINGLHDALAKSRQRITELEVHVNGLSAAMEPQHERSQVTKQHPSLQQIFSSRRPSIPGRIQATSFSSPVTPNAVVGSAISETTREHALKMPPGNSNGFSKFSEQTDYSRDESNARRHSVFDSPIVNHNYDPMPRRHSQSTVQTDRRSVGSISTNSDQDSPIMNSMTPPMSVKPPSHSPSALDPPQSSPSPPIAQVPSTYVGPLHGWRPVFSNDQVPQAATTQRKGSQEIPCQTGSPPWKLKTSPQAQPETIKNVHMRAPSVSTSERPSKRSKIEDSGSANQTVDNERSLGERPRPAPRITVPVTVGETRKPPSSPSTPMSNTVDLTQTRPHTQSSTSMTEQQSSNIPTQSQSSRQERRPNTPAEAQSLDMSPDERVMFSAIGRVLMRKKEDINYKCALCRLEKVQPATSFGQDTPIGSVTRHVKETHVMFWNEISKSYFEANPSKY